MPDDVVIHSLADAKQLFNGYAIFVVSKDDKEIGCFMLTFDYATSTNSAYSFVHPRSCKLGLLNITVLSLLVLLRDTPITIGHFVFHTSQKVIANKWIEVWPFIEVENKNPLSYVGKSYDLIINDQYLTELLATKCPQYCISVVS